MIAHSRDQRLSLIYRPVLAVACPRSPRAASATFHFDLNTFVSRVPFCALLRETNELGNSVAVTEVEGYLHSAYNSRFCSRI